MKLLRLLFPPKCVFCGGFLEKNETDVCESCLDSIELSLKIHPGEHLSAAVSALKYEGAVRGALKRFKYSGRQSYAPAFAKTIVYALKMAEAGAFDLIAAVPSTRKNIRKRGYNQAALLAAEVAKSLQIPFVDALEKTRATAPMYGLNRAERAENVAGSIAVGRGRDKLKDSRILLIDDIFTTGATANECARALIMAGAAEVYCAAVASGH